MTDCVTHSRTLDVLLRRGGDLPVGTACALLRPVADTLDALHRRGRSHGAVSATQVTVTLRDGELGVELSDPVDGGVGETPGAAGIPGDYVSFGSLVVRCLVRTLGPDDRRAISRGHDPVVARRATSCAALVEAARVAVAPLPGDGTDPEGFWEERPTHLGDLRARRRTGPRSRRVTSRRRRLLAVGVSTFAVVAFGSVLVARASGGSPTITPSASTTTSLTTTTGTGTSTATDTTTPPSSATKRSDDPSADEAALSSGATGPAATLSTLVPAALRDDCRPPVAPAGTRAEERALAVLECGTDDTPVRYSLFSDADAMNAAFAASAPAGLRGPTDLSGPPRCLDGETEERAWSRSAGDPAAGRYRCEVDSAGAAVVWTTDAVAVLGRVSTDAGEPTAGLSMLYRLWRTVLGPVAP